MESVSSTFEGGDHHRTTEKLACVENPMLNSVVLRHFFQVVPLSHLKNWRLVCRLWWEESLPRWREEVWIVLDDNEDDNWKVHRPAPTRLSMGTYFQMLIAPSDPYYLTEPPFQKYILNNWELRLRRRTNQTKFWKAYGHLVKQLEIRYSTVFSYKAFRRILFDLTPNLEYLFLNENYYGCRRPKQLLQNSDQRSSTFNVQNKLKDLKIALTFEYMDQYQLPFLWTEILEQFPNIKNLTLKSLCFAKPYEKLDDLLMSIKCLRAASSIGNELWKLQKLHILDLQEKPLSVFPLTTLSYLEELCFPLTSLSIDIGSGTTWHDFKRILTMSSNTLQQLVLYSGGESAQDPCLSFPFGVVLNALRELRFAGPFICHNLDFLQFTPHLRKLEICYFQNNDLVSSWKLRESGSQRQLFLKMWERTHFNSLNSVVLTSMEVFLVGDDWVCDHVEAEAITRMMPNLKVFGKRKST